MKKITFLLLLVYSCISAQTWEPVGPDDFNQACFSELRSYSSAIDNNNNIYVIYQDVLSGQKASVRKYADGSWQAVGNPGISNEHVQQFDITVADDNTVYIVYAEISDGFKLVVKKFNGIDWEFVGVEGLAVDAPVSSFQFTIDTDVNNVPYVLYSVNDVENWVCLKKFNGSQWEAVGTEQIALGNVSKGGLAFNSSNVPYISYGKGYNGYEVRYLVNGAWQVLGDAPLIITYASNVSIIIGQDNLPVLSYSAGSTPVAMIKKLNGTVWEDMGQPDPVYYLDTYARIAYDDNGVLYAALLQGSFDTATMLLKKYVNGVWQNVGPQLSYDDAVLMIGDNVPYIVSKNYVELDGVFETIAAKFNGIEWETLGDKGFGGLSPSSIVVDNNNIPYLGYYDPHNQYKLTIRKFNGTVWQQVGGAINNLPYPLNNMLAIDNNNIPYVAYNEIIDPVTSAKRLTVAKFNGVDWMPISSQSIVDFESSNISMTFDSNNVLYVFCRDATQEFKGIVKKFDGTGWTSLGVTGVGTGQIVVTELEILTDKNNVPYIKYSYYNTVLNERVLSVERFNGTGWSIVGEMISSNDIFGSSIAIDENDVVYVSYVDITEEKLYVKKLVEVETETGVEEQWEFVGTGSINETPVGDGYPPVIMKIDSENRPFLVYNESDEYGVPKAIAKRFNGTDWELAGNANFTAGSYYGVSMDIGNDDVAYVAHGGMGIFVKSFDVTTMGVGEKVFSKDKMAVYPNPVADVFKISSADAVGKIEIYDLQGKLLVKKNYDGEVSVESLPTGLYLLKIYSDKGSQSFKIIKQ